ncbi:chemotaxis protein CheD [Iodobacter sp.]|uniref:chemotaxis protein CheD n=1 Tax=Iodobacter sp. TaxID=1915058 RepID=UPI0025E23E1E|nr:chemotaxis protein CheD [Iodobacter sp.]
MSTKRIFLLPGDVRFAQAPGWLYTILGSCLAITAWHPYKKHGGMCHFQLPNSSKKAELNGRYGRDAFSLLCQQMSKYTSQPSEYRYQIYGGSQILKLQPSVSIGARNIQAAKQLLANAALAIDFEDTGGHQSRKIELDLSTGQVWVQRLNRE